MNNRDNTTRTTRHEGLNAISAVMKRQTLPLVFVGGLLFAGISHGFNPDSVSANALPQNGQVSQGNATISTSGNTTTITQSSDKAVVNWNSFNVGNNAHVRFQQPSSSSWTLNRQQP